MSRFTSLLCLLLAIAAFANDSAVTGEGGRVSRIKGEKTSVRMVKETVRMDLYPDYYDVTADFLFQNDGPAVTVTMGFPESGGGDIHVGNYENRTSFLSFRTWVDDQEVKAVRQKATGSEENFRAFWTKSVSFTTGQQRRVRVAYRSKPSNSVTTIRFALYDFTGGNWKGKVEESTLILTPHLPGTWVLGLCDLPDRARLKQKTWKDDQLTLRWTDWQAEGNFEINYNSTFPGWVLVEEMKDPYDPTVERHTVTQKGYTKTLDWMPPVMYRDGQDFISLDNLEQYLHFREQNKKNGKKVSSSWNRKTLEATFSWDGITYGFKLKRQTMTVSGSATVILPTAPFLSRNRSQGDSGVVYIPLQPLIKALGGKATINRADHRGWIKIP